MNRTLKIWFTGMVSLCLSACGDHASSGGDEPSAGMPIGFSSEVTAQQQAQTRGDVLTEINELHLFASYTGTADWNPASHSFNYMYNQSLTKTTTGGATTWTYSPLKYWPGNPADKISFFAYAPTETQTKGYITVSDVNATNPVLTYTPPANESDKLDLLAASVLNCTNATQQVRFAMKHALTQVTIKVRNGDPTNISKITLSSATITMPGTGSLTFNAALETAAFTWTPDASADKITTFIADVLLGDGGNVELSNTDGINPLATFFLLPVGNPSAQVAFTLTYTLAKTSGPNSGSTTALTSIVALPATPSWEAGKKITYTVSIIDDRLEIKSDGITVTEFGEGTEIGGNDGIPAT